MKKKVFLSIVLSVICFVSVFAFFGCGETDAAALTKKFQDLNAVYETHSETFVAGNVMGLETKHKVDFGKDANPLVEKHEGNFGELETIYNLAFAISNDYIDQNYEYVCEFLSTEKDISNDAKNKVGALNKSLDTYINQIDTFLTDMKIFQRNITIAADADGVLRAFEKSFGKLVDANINVSTNLADVVEATKIYELLEGLADPMKSDIVIVQDFIRAKTLHVFTDFTMTEIANQMNWEVQNEGDCKKRINDMISDLNLQRSIFLQNFVLTKTEFNESERAPEGAISKLLDSSKEFWLEAEAYSKALKGVDFFTLATKYHNNLANYLKTNKFAEIYMEKLESFISNTLPMFLDGTSKIIYDSLLAKV